MKLLNGSKELNSYFDFAVLQEDTELELIFGSNISNNPITKKVFLSLLEKCKTNYHLLSESSSLDIRYEFKGNPSNVRCTINGLESIKKYCRKDSLESIDDENIEYIIKKYFKDPKQPGKKFFPLKDNDYNIRLNIKKEEPLLKNSNYVISFLKDYQDKKKHFRYKKRYSFLTEDKLYRIDLTMVKSTKFSRGKHQFEKTFREADILNNREEYELEIEYLGHEKEHGIKKIDLLAKKLKNEYIIREPDNNPNGNIYDPLNLGISIEHTEEEEIITDEGNVNEFGSPRFAPKGDYLPYTISSIKYSQEEYRNLIGKYTHIRDEYFTDYNIDLELRDSLKEYYKKGKKITFIREVYEKISNGDYIESSVKIELIHKMGKYTELIVPIQYLYSGYFTIEEERIIQRSDDDNIPELNQMFPDAKEEKENIINQLISLLETHVIYLSKIIYETDTLLSYQLREKVLKSYMNLTEQKSRYFNFIGPQPVTLNFDDIQTNNPKSILVDYAVTEKADGERYELLINEGRGYLINSKSSVIDMGITFKNITDDWLFDGEYITKTKNGENIRLYMVFDIYWAGKTTPQPIHTYPFISHDPLDISRKSVLDDFFQAKDEYEYDENSIELNVKTYEFGYLSDEKARTKKNKLEIFKASRKILKRETEDYYPYEIDGLIYLPVRLSVKGHNEGVQSKYIGGTWPENFKWKPEHLNTIDFLGKIKKTMIKSKVVDEVFPIVHKNNEGIEEISEYKQLELYVGYNENDDDSINFCMKILEGTRKKDSKDEIKQFNFHSDQDEKYNFTNILLKDGKMICKNGDEIKNNDIIELRFNKEAKDSMFWEPLRVRYDKLKPQYFNVANNVWETIQTPITSQMIQGLEKFNTITNQSEEEGKYYIKDSEDQLLESNQLRQLHNYIKSKLIGGITSSFKGPIRVLDLSIGRGGDVKKFKNYSFILGLDISSNIHEACKRYYNTKNNIKGVFLRADTSKNIKSGECSTIIDNHEEDRKHCETMITILYDHKKPIPPQYTDINYRYRGLAKDGFEVVSSQFSMHYYFENQSTFNGFILNLKENVKKNGYFIGTCYDGLKIFNHFKVNNNQLEYKEDTGKLIYSVKKKYDIESFDYNKEDTSNMLGNVISVYMESIGQELDEYLVNFDHLKDEMESNGFILMNPTNIPKKFSNIFRYDYFGPDGLGSFENVIDKIPEIDQSDNDFGKYYPEARSIHLEKSKELRLLSGFNKYFIFQRID